ncbi:MAG: M15 family metallopeptidase [Candidatus Dactylopiibacterium sp.]|nr:M15 family metallopeptidase [Candidatus Dactylopiibacterium sp.]
MLADEALTGRSDSHVRAFALPGGASFRAQPQAGEALLALHAAAAQAGIDLAVASAWRGFVDQARIWQAKWRGERPLYDAHGQPLDYAALDEAGRVAAILEWSALPGASRHHWGSEFDVYDRAALPEGYRLQLLPAEYAPDGPFARLSAWLDAHMAAFGFFRPYDAERGGMHVEPWHLSFAPVSLPALPRLTPALMAHALSGSELGGEALVRAQLAQIHARQVCLVGSPSPETKRT